MHLFAYLLPPIAVFAHYVWVTQYGGWPRVDVEVYAVAFCVAEAVIGLAHYLARVAGMDVEYLSGYVTVVQHYRAWTERQVYYETVRDSRGNSRQVQRVRYIQHPEYWTWTLNDGYTHNISYSVFSQLVYRWGGRTEYFATHHVNCVAGGGGDLCHWDQRIEHIETETYTHRYTNPLDRSNSIFRFDTISDKQASEMGLYPYPEIVGYEQDPIQGLGLATEADQQAFRLLNAMQGEARQVHFFVLLYEADKGLEIGEKQRAYWHGGNKNEFTICLGVELPQRSAEQDTDASETTDASSSPQFPVLRWCNAFSWMDEPRLEVAIEQWALEQQGKPIDLQAFCQWLWQHLDLWQRKEWKDFKYIANPMVWWQLLIVYLTAIISVVLMWLVFLQK